MIVKIFYFSWLQMLMVLETYDRKYMGNLTGFVSSNTHFTDSIMLYSDTSNNGFPEIARNL